MIIGDLPPCWRNASAPARFVYVYVDPKQPMLRPSQMLYPLFVLM